MSLLQVENLCVEFSSSAGPVNAVNNASLSLNPGEIRGIVGESGSGKSVLSLALLGLIDDRAKVRFDHLVLCNCTISEPRMHWQTMSKNAAIVFQDPSNSLNPALTVGYQLLETLAFHHPGASTDFLHDAQHDILTDVGFSDIDEILPAYPHQLADGSLQRLMIALALSCSPKLLIADEATTNLDPTIQAQILDLITHLSRSRNMAVITITHDFAILAETTDTTSVMYCGYIVESGPTHDLLATPMHPYTKALIDSVPHLHDLRCPAKDLFTLPGSIPPAHRIPVGCPLGPRCPRAGRPCVQLPPLVQDGERAIRCHFPREHRL